MEDKRFASAKKVGDESSSLEVEGFTFAESATFPQKKSQDPTSDLQDDSKKKSESKGEDKGKQKYGQKSYKKKKNGGNKSNSHSERQSSKGSNKVSGCFMCEGLHRARDCPKREKLNALVTDKQTEYSDGDSESDYPSRVNPLQLVNALQAVKTSQNGLLYVRARINGVDVLAMMDSGATHNFVTDRVATQLKLKLVQNRSRMKAVNSEAKMISGMAKDVEIHVGDWKGKTSLFSVLLDDFDVILGLEFFLQAKVALVPHLGGLFIADEEQPCFVHAEWRYKGKGKTEKLSALRLSSSASAESGVENSSVEAEGITSNETIKFPNSKTGCDSFGAQASCCSPNLSSVEAKGFTFTETVIFPKPKTGHGSFDAHASCCSPNPKNSERISHVEAGKKKSPHMKPCGSALTRRTRGQEPEHVYQTNDLLQGVIATLSNEVREDDVKNEVVEDFKKLNLGENASNSGGGTQADRNMETNSDNKKPSGRVTE